MKYKIDYISLEKFLKGLSYKSIKEGALVEGISRYDIERFAFTEEEKSKIRLNQVIEYNMPFLVDYIGNDLSVCILTKRKYKKPNGRISTLKFDRTIIDDCSEVLGGCVNGYFIIPERFIEEIL